MRLEEENVEKQSWSSFKVKPLFVCISRRSIFRIEDERKVPCLNLLVAAIRGPHAIKCLRFLPVFGHSSDDVAIRTYPRTESGLPVGLACAEVRAVTAYTVVA